MTIPENLKPTSFGTVYSETELRQAIAFGEIQQLLGVGGGGGGGSGGDASAANQQVLNSEAAFIRRALIDVENGDIDFNRIGVILSNIQGIRNELSQGIEVDIRNSTQRLIDVEQELINIRNRLDTFRFFFFTNISKQEITLIGDAAVVDTAQRGKNISFQVVINNLLVGESLTFEAQFSNNQGLVNAGVDTNPAYWSNISPSDEQISINSNGVFPYFVENIPASHIRFVLINSSGAIPDITVYTATKA